MNFASNIVVRQTWFPISDSAEQEGSSVDRGGLHALEHAPISVKQNCLECQGFAEYTIIN